MKCIPSEHTLKNGSVIIARSLCAATRSRRLLIEFASVEKATNLSRYPDETE